MTVPNVSAPINPVRRAASGHPWTAAVSATIGAYAMAAFHGLRGAFWLNTAAGRPNPATPASPGTQGG
jgi:hypothetical protein